MKDIEPEIKKSGKGRE